MKQDILNDINGYPLDIEQRKVVMTNDHHILVIAGAGAGKTLTIIGKIRYLIEKEDYNQKDILCISFTNEATKSLKEKLKINYNYEIDVLTFHKLSLNILKNSTDFEIASDNFLNDIIDYFFKDSIYSYPPLIHTTLKYLKIRYRNSNYINKFQRINNLDAFHKFKKTIHTFIKLFKSNNSTIDDFKKYLSTSKKKDYHFLIVAYAIYIKYQTELDNLELIDFDDMINKAINSANLSVLKYKYIIVDEYQDTSLSRYQLLKRIIDVTNAKLMVVGDDWQSIYRFSGCSLDTFLNFTNHFKNSRVLQINHTYRNSQELIEVAGKFIMRNKRQIKKDLIALKHINKPIQLIYYKNKQKDLTMLINKLYKQGSLLILGRNNFDISKFLDYDIFDLDSMGIISFKNKQKSDIRFLTVHKAKGLESDNVIIINLEDQLYGFPNKLEDEKVLRYVNNTKDYISYEEERRLFYVALTRSKNKVYLYVSKNNISIFVKEIKKSYKKYYEIVNLKRK